MTENQSDRAVDPDPKPGDHQDYALRPQTLNGMIGQNQIRENLEILISAAQHRGEALDHVLFYGPPGLGKTTLAHILANEMSVNIKITSGPAVERAGDLAAIRAVEEILYPAMEDYSLDIIIGKGPSARSVRLKLPRFTIVGATTRLALVTAPLRARFGAVYRLDYYTTDSIRTIIVNASSQLQVPFEQDGITEIASRSRGTPRVALRLLRRVRDFAQVRGEGIITPEITQQALDLLSIDHKGLDSMDRRVLEAIVVKYQGGPVGLKTIAASIREDPDTIMDVVEPYLLQLGFMQRTAQGRVATQLAYLHLGLEPPADAAQPRLIK